MEIKSNIKNYNVRIHNELCELSFLFNEKNALYVVDEKVYNIYKENFKSIETEKLVIFNSLENNKNINSALEICEKMTEIPAKRNAHLISIGGGIVQDVTGFVANILYRGINWTFIPTTLLAACDSCIGGKTSLNYKNYKNLFGTFYPPNNIYICPTFFNSLEYIDFESGLGEVVKFNIMYGQEGLSRIEKDIQLLLDKNQVIINKYLETSLTFKKQFIEQDEFDKGERIKLNFAHTFGHAFESISNYAIPHGTAVAMGTIVANFISTERNWMSKEITSRIEQVLLRIIHINLDLINFNMSDYINAMQKDKKQTSKALTAILMYDNMKLKVINDLTIHEIEKSIAHLINLLKGDYK